MTGLAFSWIGGDPASYRALIALGIAVCAGLALVAKREPRSRWLGSPWLFGGALLLALFLYRWPVVLDPDRLSNPDEAQIAADALAHSRDPVPFRSVDTHTAGPFSSLSLMLFSRGLYQPIDFITTRLFGLVCLWLLVLSAWRSLAVVTDESRARWLALPALLAFGSGGVDLFQFNNEQPTAAALAVGCWLLAPLANDARSLSLVRIFAGAVFVGLTPLVKPQSAPMVLVVAVLGGLGLWFHRSTRARFAPAFACYAIGGVLPALAVAVSCTIHGLWGDVFRTFIGNNLAYASGRQFAWSELVTAIDRLAAQAGPPRPVLWSAVFALLAGAFLARGMVSATRRLALAATALFLAAVLAVAAPGRMFPHYLFFLIGPASLVVATVTLAAWQQVERAGTARRRQLGSGALAMLWLGMTWLPLLRPSRHAVPESLGPERPGRAAMVRVREAVDRYSDPGDALAVWGWAPWVYVWTQRAPAPHEAHSQRQIELWGDAAYYRERFAADLRRVRPVLFLDAVGPADFTYRKVPDQAHEGGGPVAQCVSLHYVYLETVAGFRFYLRRDRAAHLRRGKAGGLAALEMAEPRPDFWAASEPTVMGHADGGLVLSAHAPCQLGWSPASEPRRAKFVFGMPADATRGNNQSDGVEFRVFTVDFATGEERQLFSRLLQPLTRAEDHGDHRGEVTIPAGVSVIFETSPGPSWRNAWDWAYWRSIEVRPQESR